MQSPGFQAEPDHPRSPGPAMSPWIMIDLISQGMSEFMPDNLSLMGGGQIRIDIDDLCVSEVLPPFEPEAVLIIDRGNDKR